MKQKRAFSKTLLIQESVLLWIMTLVFLFLAYMSIDMGYTGSLPWLSAMVSFPWAAYAVSAGFYYSKSKAENTVGGITYESAFKQTVNSAQDVLTVDKIDTSDKQKTINTNISDTEEFTQEKTYYNDQEYKNSDFESSLKNTSPAKEYTGEDMDVVSKQNIDIQGPI